jgi:hypothetical protein
MPKSHKSALLDSLKSRLAEAPAPAPLPPPATAAETIRAAATRPQGVNKISVSLYAADLARLDEIKEYMRARGTRKITDSEAIRLAVRSVSVGSDLETQYEHMGAEDLRRRR